ncbi:unnamed protein product, partial [Rotaria sp. Silwood1]
VHLLDVMHDRDVDLLPYIGWDGNISNLDIIKQKLIDARISLESTSIQSKKESIVDMEKLCEKISYRAGGDAKFNLMMTVIRTYRYTLNEYEKANEIENKMQSDLKNEMISATTEERQALQQRCQANDFIIASDENESFVDFDDTINAKEYRLQFASIINFPEEQSSVPHIPELRSRDSVGGSDLSYARFTDTRADEEVSMKMKEKPVPAPPPPPPLFASTTMAPQLSTHTTMKQALPTKGRLPKPSSAKISMSESLIRPLGSINYSMAQPQVGALADPYYMYYSPGANLPPISQSTTVGTAPLPPFPRMPPPPPPPRMPPPPPPPSFPQMYSSYAPLPQKSAVASTTSFSQAPQMELPNALQAQSLLLDQSAALYGSEGSRMESSATQTTTTTTTAMALHPWASTSGKSLPRSAQHGKSMIVAKKSQTSMDGNIQSSIELCSIVDESVDNILLLDVCPLGLGIEDIHGQMHTFIRRNTTIPTCTQFYPIFTNAYAYQITATIRIFEGEHNLTKYNNFLGEFNLCGLTSNYAAQTLEISIRMDLDANGILHVDAEETRSGAKASFIITSNDHQRLTKDDIERHITYVNSDPSFAAKSVYDRKSNDPLYKLDGQTESVIHNFSGETMDSCDQMSNAPLLSKLKDVRSSATMIEELFKLQSKDGSFTLNKDLADVFQIDVGTFNGLENYLREQALNIRNEILCLIGTGVILIWLTLQTLVSQQSTFQFLFDIEQMKIHLCNHLPANVNHQINKAIEFYQRTNQRIDLYCQQLELSDSSWNMFIQRILIGVDCSRS